MGEYRTSARALFGVTFFFWFSQYAYTSYLNSQLQMMGATAAFMGIVGGGYGFTQLAARFPLGVISDRLQRQRLFVLGGCMISAVSAFGMYVWYTPLGFLFFRAAGGLAASAWVSFTVLYGSYFPEKQSAQAITMLNVSNQTGRLFSFVLMALCVAQMGERSSFLISGFAALAAASLCLFVRDTAFSGKPICLRDLPVVLRDRHLLNCTFLAVLTQFVAFSTYNAFSVNYAIEIGANAAQLSIMNIVLVAPLAIVNYMTARHLLPRFGAKCLLGAGFSLTIIYCILFPLSVSMYQVYLLQGAAGIANSFTMSVLLGICVEKVQPNFKATAMGFFQAAYGIGMTVGPIVMGVCIQRIGMKCSFWGMGIVSAVTLGFVFKALPGRKTV